MKSFLKASESEGPQKADFRSKAPKYHVFSIIETTNPGKARGLPPIPTLFNAQPALCISSV